MWRASRGGNTNSSGAPKTTTEVGSRQITVNSVSPGYLDTTMSAGLEQRQRQQIIGRTPLGRLGTVDDVVPVIRFLLGPEAGFVTGQTIVVDGGISV